MYCIGPCYIPVHSCYTLIYSSLLHVKTQDKPVPHQPDERLANRVTWFSTQTSKASVNRISFRVTDLHRPHHFRLCVVHSFRSHPELCICIHTEAADDIYLRAYIHIDISTRWHVDSVYNKCRAWRNLRETERFRWTSGCVCDDMETLTKITVCCMSCYTTVLLYDSCYGYKSDAAVENWVESHEEKSSGKLLESYELLNIQRTSNEKFSPKIAQQMQEEAQRIWSKIH